VKSKATKQSAFLAGLSIGALMMGLDLAPKFGLPVDPNSILVIVVVFGYFLFTMIFLVLGVPKWIMDGSEIPPYFPRTSEQWSVVTSRWVRMLLWLVGGAAGFALLMPFK